MGKSTSRSVWCVFGFWLIAALFLRAQTPVPIPVTGNLNAISGSPQAYAGILIQLQNCPYPISITGYAGIVQTSYQLQADGSGNINGSVWANDQITCNGTTGNSQYSEVAIVNGVPSGTPLCYQVVSTQGVWYLNGQQAPIACSQTPPNPQDGSFRNLTSTGFFQGNNGAMTGTWTVNGLLWAKGGFQLGTAAQNCVTGYMTGISDTLAPICNPVSTAYLTSFNGRTAPAAVPTTGDYSYSMISSTPTFGSTPAAPSGYSNVTFQQSGTSNSAYIPASGVTAGACTNPTSVTFGADGRATSCTTGPSTPAARIIATAVLTSCALGNGSGGSGVDPDGGWSCSGTISWPSTLPDTNYHTVCTMTYPNSYGSGTYNYSKANPTSFNLNPGTTTTTGQGYLLGDHQSGSNGATFPLFCMAIE